MTTTTQAKAEDSIRKTMANSIEQGNSSKDHSPMILDCSRVTGRFVPNSNDASKTTSTTTTTTASAPPVVTTASTPAVMHWRPIQPMVTSPSQRLSSGSGGAELATVKRRYNRRVPKPISSSRGMRSSGMPPVPLVMASNTARVPVSFLPDQGNVAASPSKACDVITTPMQQQPIISPGHQFLIRAAAATQSPVTTSSTMQRPPLAFSTPHLFQCANGTSFQLLPIGGHPFQLINCSTPSQVVLAAAQPHNIQDILQSSVNRKLDSNVTHSDDGGSATANKSSPSAGSIVQDNTSPLQRSGSPPLHKSTDDDDDDNDMHVKSARAKETAPADIPMGDDDDNGDSFVTHVVDGYIIKESRKPFPAVDYNHNETRNKVREDDEGSPKKKRGSGKPVTAAVAPTPGTRNQPKRTGERKESRVEDKSVKEIPSPKRSRKRSVPVAEPVKDFQEDDPESWTIDQVGKFIEDRTGSPELAEKFRSHEIDGSALLLIKEEFLMQFMDMKLGPALKLCNRITELRKRALSSLSSSANCSAEQKS